jgi:hypothetical protein
VKAAATVPIAAQLTVTVVVHAPILAGMGARTALATITPSKSVEIQAAAIENLMKRMGCSSGLNAALTMGKQREVPVVPERKKMSVDKLSGCAVNSDKQGAT